MYYQLDEKGKKVYFLRNIDIGTTKNIIKFKNNYEKKFGISPLVISVYAYDAMSIIAQTYKKYGIVNSSTIDGINYQGISGVRVFNNRFTPSKISTVLKLGEKGYETA